MLVYMVMAAQFESLVDPFLILFSIPFAFTSVAGMKPMVFSRGEGSAMWKPMGATIAGGLMVSMLITLVLVPTLYSLAHSRAERKKLAAAGRLKGVVR